MAIALFYALATGIGGAVGPLLFGRLLGGEDPTGVALGYWIAAGLMAFAAVVEILREQGPLSIAGLKAHAGTRYWGPGCLSAALRRARAQGRIRRAGFRTYAAT